MALSHVPKSLKKRKHEYEWNNKFVEMKRKGIHGLI